ncbi:MAG: hypothetical protein IKP65_06665 [Alphaproteobacteria bacterium]|nr:hypothetical protein [Alphaproteobacteria bacterium]
MIVSAAFGWGIMMLIIAITCGSALIYSVSKGLEVQKSLKMTLEEIKKNRKSH